MDALRTLSGSGEALCQKALILAAPDGLNQPRDIAGAAEVMQTFGRLAMAHSNFSRALECFQQSLTLYEQANMPRGVALERGYIGVVFLNMGDYSRAAELLREALQLAEALHDDLLVAETLNDLSFTYVQAGEPDLALSSLSRCLKIFRVLGDEQRLSWALDSLGQAYLLKGLKEEALACIMGAVEMANRQGNWRDVTRFKQSAGEAYRAMGDSYRAQVMFKDELDLARQYGQLGEECSALFSIAELYLADGHSLDALPLLERADEIAAGTQIRPHLRQCCLLFSRAYKQLGDYACALEYHERFYLIDKEIFNAEADQRLCNLQVLYQLDAAHKETELFQLRAQTLQQEVEERKRSQIVLEQMARTDSLTGLLNRRAFFELAEKALAVAVERHSALSIILIDVDHFKDVNDRYGHMVGDQALAVISMRLRSHLRAGDSIARYGGEEFIILLAGIDQEAAMITAERLRVAVADEPVNARNSLVPVTLSLGVASMEPNCRPQSLDHLISCADEALYDAKRSGRNTVCAHVCSEPDTCMGAAK